MTTLSLCMIVKNEESCIAKAISSVKEIVDEVIVVDTGSSDQTIEKAKQLGARTFSFEWCDDFAAARNFSIKQANSEWILVLDADEILNPDDAHNLKRWISETHSSWANLIQTTYSFEPTLMHWKPNRLECSESQGYPGYLESSLVRLFKRDPSFFFSGLLHEEVICDEPTMVPPENINIRIHHYGQVNGVDRKEKKDLYLRVSRKKMEQNSNDPKAVYEYAVSSWEVGNENEARKGFLQVLQLFPTHVSSMIALATLVAKEGQKNEALAILKRALELQPNNVAAMIGLSDLFVSMGQIDDARVILEKAHQVEPHHPQVLKKIGITKLSLCMIVKNEERHLARCIESVRGLVDEIVIVDTGSTDNSISISKKLGAKVISAPWENDFSKARNLSLDHANGEWILVLDADEVIAISDHSKILDLIHKPFAEMYRLIQTTYCPESATFGWVPNHLQIPESQGYPGYIESPLVRLFLRKPEIRFSGIIHEHARHQNSNLPEQLTSVRIHHYGKYSPQEIIEKKDQLYLKLGLEKCRQHPEDAQAHYELGSQFWNMNQIDEAKKEFLTAESLDSHYSAPQTALASIATTEKNYREAVRRFLKVVELEPQSHLPYLYLPTLLVELGEVQLAEKMIQMGLSVVGDHPTFQLNRGVVQQSLGNFRGSLESFDRALSLNPQEPLVWLNKAISLTELGEWDLAEKAFQKAVKEKSSLLFVYQKWVELYFKKRDLKKALEVSQRALEIFPSQSELLYQQSVIHIQNGEIKKAQDVLAKIQSYQSFDQEGLKQLKYCYQVVGNTMKAKEMEILCKQI